MSFLTVNSFINFVLIKNMNFFTKNDLISIKDDIGNIVELKFNEESSVIVSEYGGRLLGLFPKNDVFSLLWVNPEIKNVIKSRQRDIGGDRYWISPERAFFSFSHTFV